MNQAHSKRLLLLRHGEAEPIATSRTDFERDLTPSGFKKLEELGRYLKQQPWQVKKVFVSSATRATRTFEAMQVGLGVDWTDRAETRADFYLTGRDAMLAAVASLDDAVDCVLMIGHNPGWTEAVALLCGDYRSLAPGQMAVLEAHDASADWSTLLAGFAGFRLHSIGP